VASPIPIAGGAKTGVGLQCGDSSCVGGFLLGEKGCVGFFAFATRGEELLDSGGGSARVSVFRGDPCKATMTRAFKGEQRRNPEDNSLPIVCSGARSID